MSETTLPPESLAIPARTLTTWKIIVLIIAALTPLSVVVGTLPLGLAFGGPSTALMFLAAGLVVGLFCVGYVQMVRRISRPGAFYNYIARGLGRSVGVGGAFIAVVAYPVGLIAAFAAGAFVISSSFTALGIPMSYEVAFVLIAVVIGVLVWRQIDVSALVSGMIVAIELALLLALTIAIIVHHGLAAFSLTVLSPSVFHYGSWTVAFIFAILVFQGFEAGALYAPEARKPERTIPRALVGALLILTLTFFLVSWVITSVTGVAQLTAAVQKAGIVGFILAVVAENLGPVGTVLFGIGTILATTVCTLAVTNFMARYLNGLAKDELLPKYLARTNKHGAPATSAYTLIGLATLASVVVLLLKGDPYIELGAVGFGIGALGSTALLLVSSVAVVAFFLRQPRSERHWWTTFTAPILATVLLVCALIIELSGFSYITGSTAAWTSALPYVIPIAFVVGVVYGVVLKRSKPGVYALIASGDSAEEAADLRLRYLELKASEPVA